MDERFPDSLSDVTQTDVEAVVTGRRAVLGGGAEPPPAPSTLVTALAIETSSLLVLEIDEACLHYPGTLNVPQRLSTEISNMPHTTPVNRNQQRATHSACQQKS